MPPYNALIAAHGMEAVAEEEARGGYLAVAAEARGDRAAGLSAYRWSQRQRAAALGATTLALAASCVAAARFGFGTPRMGRLAGPLEEKVAAWNGQCPGNIGVKGYGPISLTNAKWNVPGEAAGMIEPKNGTDIVAYMTGRTYFSDKCSDGTYGNKQYAGFNMLGKTLRYSTDLSGAGCGCNAALYLVSMKQNSETSECGDYYCDAMKVCGVACEEIDLQEANMYAWFSTLHLADDGEGFGFGYGGDLGLPLRRDWGQAEYGPGGKCIDTKKPFDVAVSFPVDSMGQLTAMEATLSQQGKYCNVSGRVDRPMNPAHHSHGGKDRMQELTAALSAGMTPVVSFWSSKDMTWMDGPGEDQQGPPCPQGTDEPGNCPDSVRFMDFRLEDLPTSSGAGEYAGQTA